MADFDKQAYEVQQHERVREVTDRLRAIVALDEFGHGPVVEFTCPRGHSLKRYRLSQLDDLLQLEPLPGESSRQGPVAANGSPWRSRTVCDVPGCPALVGEQGTCEQHGGRTAEQVHHIKTRFTCRPCDWSDGITTARLLQIYGMAVHLGHARITVTGAAPAADRRR